jgi:glycosyltransferase involved in cell wall biosynthesis
MNKLSFILNSINRGNRPLRIISFSTHEGFQLSMANCNAQYIMIDGPEGKKWDNDYRKMPSNIIEIPLENFYEKIEYADLILSHTINQRMLAQKISSDFCIPHINLTHIYPDSSIYERTLKIIKNSNKANITVFTTEDQRNSWGYSEKDSIIINHGIDTNHFSGWNSKNKKILSVANDFDTRGAELGFNLYNEVVALIGKENFIHIGKSKTGFSNPAKDYDDLANIYRDNFVFINTCYRSVIPTTMLEAMATGMPVVTTTNPTIDKLIKNGENGFKAKNKEEMAGYLAYLSNNMDYAKRIGNNARKTIVDSYSLRGFVTNWNNLFYKAIGETND